MRLTPNDRFGRYTIDRLIGEGGMGRVYLARDTSLDRMVALKVLPERSSDANGAGVLQREARAAAALDHPNVVSVYDVGDIDGAPFIAMEYVAGRSLRLALDDASVSARRKLRWLLDVARAVDAAHARGVVHRDIKPSNVIVRDDDHVKVVDFGVACKPDSASLANASALVGTVPYIAPELLQGAPAGTASDQFAWGVLAYQVLTGDLPWRKTDDAPDFVAAILAQEVAPFAHRVPGLARSVEGIVLRALSKRPSARFPSMGDVVTALQRSDTDEPTVTHFEATDTRSFVVPAPPPRARNKRLAALGLAAIVALASVYVLRQTPHASTLAPAATAPAPRPTAVTDLPLPVSTRPDALVAYRQAMQAFRDGAYATAVVGFQDASDKDPSMAAAHLRVSIATFYRSASDARMHFQRAVDLRATMSEHDQLLLDAYEPYIRRQPSDHEERLRRLRALVERFPEDADFALYLGRALADLGETDYFARALAIDPKFGLAYGFLAQQQAYAGDLDGANRTIAGCLGAVPSAMFCTSQRTSIDVEEGNSTRLAEDARQIIAQDPSLDLGYYRLAMATYARGGGLDATTQAVGLAWARLPADTRAAAEAEDRYALAVLSGDFGAAARNTATLERLAASDSNRTPHALVARQRVELLTETSRNAEAAKVAAELLRRQDAWMADPRVEDLALLHDVTPLMLATLRSAGGLGDAELSTRRAEWLAGWRRVIVPKFIPFLWLHGYAALADTRETAEAALAALPEFGQVPRYAPEVLHAAYVGRMYLLAGDLDLAVTHLRRATSSCLALLAPVLHTRAHLWLGGALEKKGDAQGACAAYGVVLQRWGSVARSVTADAARARTRALDCK